MRQLKAKIVGNVRIAPRYFRMRLTPSLSSQPGQFLHIRCSDTPQPFLRRPFSIHRLKDRNVEILYEVVGRGTEILSQKRPGEKVDILGPLGEGFRVSGGHPILVAGGMGVAPLLFLADSLKSKKMTVIIGARTGKKVLCAKEFRRQGAKVLIATEDGTLGKKALATDLLENEIRNIPRLRSGQADDGMPAIYACGPREMLKEVARLARRFEIPAQVSLEEMLACGTGACQGCAVKTKNAKRKTQNVFEYKLVCKDGPVFRAEDIVW